MIINDLNELHWVLKEKIVKLLEEAKKFNLNVKVFETLRTIERQKELLKKWSTKTLYSKHLERLACDIVFIDESWNPSWNSNHNWLLLWSIWKSLCLKWWWDWKWFVDCPHFEIDKPVENEFKKYRDWALNLKLYSSNENWEKPLSKDEFTKVLNAFVKTYDLQPK